MKFHAIAAALLLAAPTAIHAAPPKPTLEQRVQRMEDESQIRKMVIEYGAYLDAKDYAHYAGLFAPDGVWVGGFGSFTGPAAIAKMLTDNLGPPEPGYVNKSSFHMLTNPIIAIDGDHAHVTSKYLFWTKSADSRPTPLLAGRYVDEFVRVGGEWKIAKRTTYGAIPYRDPADPSQNDTTTAPSLEARLAKAEATLAIQRVITDYAARLDARDFDGYAALFAKDGVWQSGTSAHRGPAEIKAMLVGIFGAPSPGAINVEDYHLVSNVEVELVDADHAKGQSRYLYLLRDANGDPHPALAGRYEDEFVREDGQWKILHRTDFPVMPSPDQWLKEIKARQQQK